MSQRDTPPRAVVVHSMPGRTRLRVPERRHQPDYFRHVADTLGAQRSIRRVQINSQTASILIEHDGTIEGIASELGEAGLFSIEADHAPATRSTHKPTGVASTGAASVVAMGCIILGAYQLRRGRTLGSAADHIWHAYNAWWRLKAPTAAAALLGAALFQVARGQFLAPAASFLFYALSAHRMAGHDVRTNTTNADA